MNLDIYQVDAFSNGPFTGNPAAVIPLQEWLPDQLLQQIAEENNLAETAFFIEDGDSYHIRWFTPTVEVALCGHATLATGSVLFNELGFSGEVINFNCKSGAISVSRSDDLFTLDFPTDELVIIENPLTDLEKAIGIKPKEVYEGRDDLLCIINSRQELEELKPNFGEIARVEKRGIIVSAKGEGEFDFVSRCLFPQSGIDEDPATGSAHTTLTPYWSKKLNKKYLSACQLSKRRGYFSCKDLGSRTHISGRADLYLKGQIMI